MNIETLTKLAEEYIERYRGEIQQDEKRWKGSLFVLFFTTIFTILFSVSSCVDNSRYNNSSSSYNSKEYSKSQAQSSSLSAVEQKTEVDICSCLTELQNSEYIVKNKTACDEAIDKELGVVHWFSINFRENKAVSQRWDDIVYRCTGKRPNHAVIAGEYIGTNNFGSESVISLYNSGTLIIQSEGLDMIGGRWTGTADELNLYAKDDNGNEVLFGNANVTEDGLQITSGGGFYRRR